MVTTENIVIKILTDNFGANTILHDYKSCSGGCISHAATLNSSAGSFFVKWGQSEIMYQTEMSGLNLLAGKSSLKIPKVINVGVVHNFAYILMEMIPIGPATEKYWGALGEGLAQVHKHNQVSHGLDHDNFIGALSQKNSYVDTWADFFIERRLEVQISLLGKNQLADRAFVEKFRKIYKPLKAILPDDKPSLLHGDLWSGNILPTVAGEASIIDPAVYYGSREVEIAFTYLFGGFDKKFYQAYEGSFPLEKGFKERIPVYNLYPLLVHANMFGASYLRAVEELVRKFT